MGSEGETGGQAGSPEDTNPLQITLHQLRHAHAVEMAREGMPLNVIQRQLGHADLGVTSVYLQGIDNAEVISAVRSRRAPTMPASAGLLPYTGAPRAKQHRHGGNYWPPPGSVRPRQRTCEGAIPQRS
jgi:Phage integrase family